MLKTVAGTKDPANQYQPKKFGQVNHHFGQVKIILTCPTGQASNKLMSIPALYPPVTLATCHVF